jgi:tetratricopeptide (TPR) repeat protein
MARHHARLVVELHLKQGDNEAALAAIGLVAEARVDLLGLAAEAMRALGRDAEVAVLLEERLRRQAGSLALAELALVHALATGEDPREWRQSWLGEGPDSRAALVWAARLSRDGAGAWVIDELRAAWAADPTDPDTTRVLTRVLLDMGDPHAALQVIGQTRPEGQGPSFLRAFVLTETELPDAALVEAEALLLLQPDHAPTLNLVGYTLALRGVHLERAEQLLRRAADLDPADPHVMDSLGWLLVKAGRAEEGLPWLRRALRRLPDNEVVRDHVASARAKVESE